MECSHCHEMKFIGNFTPSSSRCKDCQSLYSKQHYENNKSKYLDRNKQHRKQIREFLKTLKSETACADCGEKYPPYVMDFDHQFNKKFNVSQMLDQSLTMVLAEIDKCEIVCANCHRIRTHASVV